MDHLFTPFRAIMAHLATLPQNPAVSRADMAQLLNRKRLTEPLLLI